MKKVWEERAWEEYTDWQQQDKRTLNKINQLLRDIDRNGYKGLGKPEALSGDLAGFWSRRIDDSNRIVYRIKDDKVEIAQCKGHYNDK